VIGRNADRLQENDSPSKTWTWTSNSVCYSFFLYRSSGRPSPLFTLIYLCLVFLSLCLFSYPYSLYPQSVVRFDVAMRTGGFCSFSYQCWVCPRCRSSRIQCSFCSQCCFFTNVLIVQEQEVLVRDVKILWNTRSLSFLVDLIFPIFSSFREKGTLYASVLFLFYLHIFS